MGDGSLTMREIGRRGGNKTKERYGIEHLRAAGAKGGAANAAKHGRSHYVEMARRSAESRRENARRRREEATVSAAFQRSGKISCAGCGSELPGEADFCWRCGLPVGTASPAFDLAEG